MMVHSLLFADFCDLSWMSNSCETLGTEGVGTGVLRGVGPRPWEMRGTDVGWRVEGGSWDV